MGIDEMLTVAYTEMGLSVDEFYNLSWYEWGLEVLKLKARNKNALNIWEGNASLIREFMALFANANRDDKKKPQPFKGSDFFKLSFDKEEVSEPKLMTPEEVEQKFAKFLKL